LVGADNDRADSLVISHRSLFYEKGYRPRAAPGPAGLGKTNQRGSNHFYSASEADSIAADGEPRDFANRADSQGQHVAAIDVQRPARIVTGFDQLATKCQHWRGGANLMA
jgi:hypothetical protein